MSPNMFFRREKTRSHDAELGDIAKMMVAALAQDAMVQRWPVPWVSHYLRICSVYYVVELHVGVVKGARGGGERGLLLSGSGASGAELRGERWLRATTNPAYGSAPRAHKTCMFDSFVMFCRWVTPFSHVPHGNSRVCHAAVRPTAIHASSHA